MKTYFVGKTEFRGDGSIKAFHLPVAHFKRVVTEDNFKGTVHPQFRITVNINKYNQIHDIQPREFNGVNVFDIYHGHQGENELTDLVALANNLFVNSLKK